jgi:hypothetical protein
MAVVLLPAGVEQPVHAMMMMVRFVVDIDVSECAPWPGSSRQRSVGLCRRTIWAALGAGQWEALNQVPCGPDGATL